MAWTDKQIDAAALAFCTAVGPMYEPGAAAEILATGRPVCAAPNCSCWPELRKVTESALKATEQC